MRIITVIPLPAPRADQLSGTLARDLAAQTLDTALGWAGAGSVVAVSNDPGLSQLALDRGLKVVSVDQPWGPDALDLPPAAWSALRELDAGKGGGAAVLLVHPHNPLLTPELLGRASQTFLADPARPLVSVHACRDHPCQLARYFRIADVDTLYLLDPAFDAAALALPGQSRDLAVSLPFAPHPQERLLFDAAYGGLVSCADGRALTELADGQACLYESATSARMVFSRALVLAPLAGLAGVRGAPCGVFGAQRGLAALFRQDADRTLTLVLGPGFPKRAGFHLRLVPFSRESTLWDDSLDIEVGAPGQTLRLPFLSAPLPASALPPQATGCIACILEECRDGSYDFKDIYRPPLAPWAMRGKRLVNLDTGCDIHGRQAFPMVMQPDGILAAYPLGPAAGAADQPPSLTDARAFPLDDAEAILVADAVDHLRAQARQQAMRRAARG